VREHSDVAARMALGGAQVLHVTKKRGLNLSDWWAVRHALRAWVPDVVLLNDSHAVPLAGSASWFCRLPRPKRIAYKHTIFPLRSQLKYRLLSDRLVCVSQAARDNVVAGGIPARRAVVIYGGCETIEPNFAAGNHLRQQLQLKPQQKLLVAVGSLLECKGHRDLVEALHLLREPRPELVLAIAGEGPERKRLEQQISDLQLTDRVHLLGYRTDAVDWMTAADLVVHPSHAEGLSLVLIQAQMLRKPIVATAVGGAAEVLAASTDACSSWLVEPGNASHLAQQLGQAIRAVESSGQGDPTQQFSARLEHTAQRMYRDFTIGKTAQKLADLAAELLR
jgi:glycosyltransferase involved in cell wall biosynthesis